MTEECGVPAMSLGPCDMPKGHEGDMHGSAGDGFYARCGSCGKDLESGKWTVPTAKGVFGYVCVGCA